MTALWIIHIVVCIFLVIVILLQASSGMDLGSAFGGGSSESFFGSKGASGFLIKVTSVLAVIFMATSILISYNLSHKKKSVIQESTIPVKQKTIPQNK